ncbi:MAG: HlyD family efflux transporter periplasmic adaptor subunit [candidate division Zixibacteria bacterium]
MSMDRKIEKKIITPKRIFYGIGSIALLVIIIYGYLSASDGATLRVEAARLTISDVVNGEFQEYISNSAEVIPLKTVYLDAIQGGQITQIYVEEGSIVKKGDSILQLDNTDLHLDIMYREAQLFEQINNLRNTRLAMEQNSLRLRADLLDIDRQIGNTERLFRQNQDLKEKKLISEFEFKGTKDEYNYWIQKRELTLETQRQDSILRSIQINQLEESVERMQNNLGVVRQKLDNLVLRAPIDGQLSSLDAEEGVSKPTGSRLGKIDVLDGFKLRVYIDEYYIARINSGQSGTVKIGDTTHSLIISKVYPEVRDGRFQIDLQFVDEEPVGIRQGQSLQIRIALGNLAMATMIPSGGFYQTTGGNWIFVLDESEELAVRREIKIGMRNPQMYEVLEGLSAGEKVITSSYTNYENFDRLVFKDR